MHNEGSFWHKSNAAFANDQEAVGPRKERAFGEEVKPSSIYLLLQFFF
jgi:hypothetical protein